MVPENPGWYPIIGTRKLWPETGLGMDFADPSGIVYNSIAVETHTSGPAVTQYPVMFFLKVTDLVLTQKSNENWVSTGSLTLTANLLYYH